MLKRLFKKSNPLIENEASSLQIKKYQANAGTFRRLFKKHFISFLKENNWKGDGFKFYKETNNETVYLLEIIPERRGGGYSVAFAIHFDFIPYRFADKIEDYSYSGLDVRGGLPFEVEGSGLLEYPTSETEVIKSFLFLREQVILAESNFFNKYGNWKEHFLQYRPEQINNREQELERITNSRFSLLCAKIFNHLGEYQRSKEMAEYGLTTIKYPTGNGSSLYSEFMELIKTANNV